MFTKLLRFKKQQPAAPEVHPLTRRIKRLLLIYLEQNTEYDKSNFEITGIHVIGDTDEGGIAIEIETCRPGLLIGKQGKTIESIVAYLAKHLENKIHINIKESTLWN